MSLGAYFLRRIVSLIPFTFGLSIVVFLLWALTPIDPVDGIAGLDPSLQMAKDDIAASLGLNKSLFERYTDWAIPMFTQLDFGTSWLSGAPVVDHVIPYIPITVTLFGIGFFFSIIISTVLGVLAAVNHRTIFDQFVLFATLIGFSFPSFALALILIFAVQNSLGILTIYLTANQETVWDNMPAIIMLEIVLIIGGIAFSTRLIRSQMLNVLNQNYIRTARAKGLPERSVVYVHALRNALIPFITVIALSLPGIISGAATIEIVFNIPGVGRSLLSAALGFDIPVVLAVTMFFGILSIFMLVVADIAYGIVDPKIQF